jgi:hypothetical protein
VVSTQWVNRLFSAASSAPNWPTCRAGFKLQVPPHEAIADRIAEYAAARPILGDIGASLADGDDRFRLTVEVLRFGRIGDGFPILDNGIGGFAEEKRRIAIRILARLSRMLGIVASNAEYPTHGKNPGQTGDGRTRCG